MESPAREAERVERIEAELDRVIERRANERRDENHVEKLYKASARRHNERMQRQIQAEWYVFHERMREVHERLGKEHEMEANKLLEGEA